MSRIQGLLTRPPTFAFSLYPRLEPLRPPEDDLANAFPTNPYITICCYRGNRDGGCAGKVEALVSKCSVKRKRLIYRMGKDGRMGKEGRDCAAKLALKDR